jgi:hypothetical protein
MVPKHFTDPLGSTLPALEQNVLKLRAMEMLLVLFYAEELKRDVLDCIQTTDGLMSRLRGSQASPERVPKGTKNPVDKALKALIADGVITAAEKAELIQLIDYRNVIGHLLHRVMDRGSEARQAGDLFRSVPRATRRRLPACCPGRRGGRMSRRAALPVMQLGFDESRLLQATTS